MNKNGYYFFDLGLILSWLEDQAESTVIDDLLKDPTAPHEVKGLVKVMLDLNAGKLTKPVMLTNPSASVNLPTYAVESFGNAETETFPHKLMLCRVTSETNYCEGIMTVLIANNRTLQINEI